MPSLGSYRQLARNMGMQALWKAYEGDTKGAIASAETSLAVAEKAGNADYVKMNKESIAEWSK